MSSSATNVWYYDSDVTLNSNPNFKKKVEIKIKIKKKFKKKSDPNFVSLINIATIY